MDCAPNGWPKAISVASKLSQQISTVSSGAGGQVAKGLCRRLTRFTLDVNRELKAEATRALAFDQLSFLASGGQPNDKTSFSQLAAAETERIKTDVYQALGRAPELIKTPTLRDNLGVRTADGLVPKSLHSLVRPSYTSLPQGQSILSDLKHSLQLVSELEKIQQQSPVSDYHPGSNGKVLDIIHPSLCAYPTSRILAVQSVDFIVSTKTPTWPAEPAS